jgi:uncharacterized protein YecT (DUF1311 family)
MPSARAQDGTYEPEDAKLMHKCVNAARAAGGQDADAKASQLIDCIGTASDTCMDQPDNYATMGMANCMDRETAWWDEVLNAHYGNLRDGLDAESFAALRDAQRNWIAFRDAECNFNYTYWREGTVRTPAYARCMLEQTAHRAIALETVIGWAL